jgi:POT family proton-dependent oligopeptide transporter
VDGLRTTWLKLTIRSPLFWLCHGTSIGNVISLAAEMKTFGLPNDLCERPLFYDLTNCSTASDTDIGLAVAGSVNPLSILILIPLL